jgi:hypothetical protein
MVFLGVWGRSPHEEISFFWFFFFFVLKEKKERGEWGERPRLMTKAARSASFDWAAKFWA